MLDKKSDSPEYGLWFCGYLAGDARLQMGMNFIGSVALASLQHLFPCRLGLGYEAGAPLR